MTFEFSIPTPMGLTPITIEPGSSLVFVGSNGGGKTRLAAMIEEKLGLGAHRISAHRALTLNPAIPKISEVEALAGYEPGMHRLMPGLTIGSEVGGMGIRLSGC